MYASVLTKENSDMMKNILHSTRHYFFSLITLVALLTTLMLLHSSVFMQTDEIIPVRQGD